MVLKDILSIVLRSCPSSALGGRTLDGRSWIPTFLYFSSLLFLSQFSIQKPATLNWTLHGKIVDSFFSHTIFLSLFLFENLQFQLWMVRSWIPTFLMPFSSERFLANSSKNDFWWVDVGEGAGCTTSTCLVHWYMLNSKHPLNIQSFHTSRGYSIYSFAQLSWHSTRKNELWMVDLGFLLFYTFLISFSFHGFLVTNLQDWTLNGKIVNSFFSHHTFLSLFLFRNLQFQLWMVIW